MQIPSARVGAIVLAAGQARRMGGVPKCLIRLDGVSVLARQLQALATIRADQVVVVTGHARERVEAECRMHAPAVEPLYNPDFAQGQQVSVRTGIAGLRDAFGAILILLADQPLICADDLRELLRAFARRPRGHVLQPMVHGRPGNPVVLDDGARRHILDSAPHLGCRDLMDRRPDIVYAYVSDNPRFVADLDTLADVDGLARSSGRHIELPLA